MTLATLMPLGLLLSISLIVLSLGARTPVSTAFSVLRKPGLTARSLGAIFVVVPAFALLLAATLPVPAAIKFAIVAMSVGPVPPTLPYKQMKAGGDADYAVGLLVAACLAAMIMTPLLVEVAARLLGADVTVSMAKVASTLLISVGAPLVVGMGFRAVAQGAAERFADVAQKLGSLLLLVMFVLMVVSAWSEILGLLGNGSVLAIAATVAVGLLAGHLLSGGRDGGALALAAATRHPGVALAIAGMSFPEQRKELTAAILLFLLVNLVVTGVYLRWMSHRSAPEKATPAAP